MTDAPLPDEILEHYDNEIDEDARIRSGFDSLELVRAQDIVRRHLPEGPLRVLDVGGASGVHSEWLLADGHSVDLIDPVLRHVEQATAALGERVGFTASLGDGRRLAAADEAYDAVLLFGPLYHLTRRGDRVQTWREAGRVLQPGGVVFGMGISRFASLLDGLVQGFLFDPEFHEIVQQDLANGQHRNPSARPGWFTTAYFHHPDELAGEAAEAGLIVQGLVAVEGVHASIPALAPRWEDAADRATILDSIRATETEPSLIGMSPHLIQVAERPQG